MNGPSVVSKGDGRQPSQRWPDRGESTGILADALEYLDVGPHRLGTLLLVRNHSSVWFWLSGRSRPSPVFLTRLLKLILNKAEREARDDSEDG